MTALPGSGDPPPYPQSPVVEQTMGIVCLVINLFFPGVGTIVAGVVGNKPQIGKGVAQLILSLILVGWVWALVTGIQILHNAVWQERNRPHAAA